MIQVHYRAIDGFSKTRSFKTLAGARKFACDYVGEFPEMGAGYAVAGDGVGRVSVTGITLAELFAAPAIGRSATSEENEEEKAWHRVETQAEFEARAKKAAAWGAPSSSDLPF